MNQGKYTNISFPQKMKSEAGLLFKAFPRLSQACFLLSGTDRPILWTPFFSGEHCPVGCPTPRPP